MWEGFEDELTKIAINIATPGKGMSKGPGSLIKVRKSMQNQNSALSSKRMNYSQVHTDPPMTPPFQDPLSSAKTIPPPPVTAG